MNKVYSDSHTLFDYLKKPSISMDRGIATKENIQYLEDNGYSYFVIERRDVAKQYKEEFSNITKEGKEYETSSGQTIYLKRKQEKDCTRVLVYSEMKAKKEDSIIGKREKRFLEDLNKLIKSNQNGYNKSWILIKQILSNHMRGTTIQRVKSGEIYNVRVTGLPEKEAKEIYDLLNIKIKMERKIKKQKIH